MSQSISDFAIPSRTRCIVLNVASAFFFYGATVAVHEGLSKMGSGSVGALSYAFVRNALGFVFALIFFLLRPSKGAKAARSRSKQIPRWGVPPIVVVRGLFNSVALFAFYLSVEYGNAGRANVLNMTYPVFVAMLSGPLLGERPDRFTVLTLILGLVGLMLHFSDALFVTGEGQHVMGDLLGLFSGITAAIAVLALRGATRVASSSVILIWMFGTGMALSLPVVFSQIPMMLGPELPYLLLSAAGGLLGQWALTESFRNLDATTGSVLSGLRIPIAIVSGLLFLHESATILAILGGVLIFSGNLLLAFQSSRRKPI